MASSIIGRQSAVGPLRAGEGKAKAADCLAARASRIHVSNQHLTTLFEGAGIGAGGAELSTVLQGTRSGQPADWPGRPRRALQHLRASGLLAVQWRRPWVNEVPEGAFCSVSRGGRGVGGGESQDDAVVDAGERNAPVKQ